MKAPPAAAPPPVVDIILPLEEGRVTLTMPKHLSAVGLQDFEDWLALVLRRMRSLSNQPPPA